MLSDLFRIVVQTGADDAEAVRCQKPAMQLIRLVLPVPLIFLIRYLLYSNLRLSSDTGINLFQLADLIQQVSQKPSRVSAIHLGMMKLK